MALVTCKECHKEISSEAKTCPNCGAKNIKQYSLGTSLVVIFIVGIFFYTCSNIFDHPNTPSTAKPVDPKQVALNSLSIKNFSWNKGGFDNVMIINLSLVNTGKKAVKDVCIRCDHYSPSGTKIDSNERTIYEVIGAGKTKRIKNFSMGFIHSQAESTKCSVTDLTFD